MEVNVLIVMDRKIQLHVILVIILSDPEDNMDMQGCIILTNPHTTLF